MDQPEDIVVASELGSSQPAMEMAGPGSRHTNQEAYAEQRSR